MAAAEVMDLDYNLPGGAWMGRQIRGIHEDSRGVFPEPAPHHFRPDPPGQMMSIMKLDYVPLVGRPTKSAPAAPRGGRPGTGGVFASLRNSPPGSQMFMSWKIPSRLLSTGDAMNTIEADNPDELLSQVAKLRLDPPENATYRLPMTSKPDRALPTESPQHHQLHDKVRNASGLPDINKTQSRLCSAREPSAKSLTDNEKKFISRTIQPAMQRRAQSWLKQAPKEDRKVIEQALRIADNKRVDKTLEKALLPDPKKAAYKWLETAHERDREVALTFFQSVAGSKLMGDTTEQQKKRLAQLIETLERGKPVGLFSLPTPRPLTKSQGGTKLQHIRLLTSNTRKNRWQHTTWHHLPVFGTNNRVENRTSIYTQPHAPVPTQYVIHPDLG